MQEPPDLLIEDHRAALAGQHAGRRFMGAALDWTATLVQSNAGLFSTYDDRGRIASPVVIQLPRSVSHHEANKQYIEFVRSGLASRSPPLRSHQSSPRQRSWAPRSLAAPPTPRGATTGSSWRNSAS